MFDDGDSGEMRRGIGHPGRASGPERHAVHRATEGSGNGGAGDSRVLMVRHGRRRGGGHVVVPPCGARGVRRERRGRASSAALDHAEQESQERCAPRRCRSASRCSSPTTTRAGGSRSRGRSPRRPSCSPRRALGGSAPAVSIGGASPGLDYWREDVLANEHHQHWHEVYPFTGLPPRELRRLARPSTRPTSSSRSSRRSPQARTGATSSPRSRPERARRAVRPGPRGRGRATCPASSTASCSGSTTARASCSSTCTSRCSPATTPSCSRTGSTRVEPFDPDAWDDPIAAGHDPIEIDGFGRREQDERCRRRPATALRSMWDEVDEALDGEGAAGAGRRHGADRPRRTWARPSRRRCRS